MRAQVAEVPAGSSMEAAAARAGFGGGLLARSTMSGTATAVLLGDTIASNQSGAGGNGADVTHGGNGGGDGGGGGGTGSGGDSSGGSGGEGGFGAGVDFDALFTATNLTVTGNHGGGGGSGGAGGTGPGRSSGGDGGEGALGGGIVGGEGAWRTSPRSATASLGAAPAGVPEPARRPRPAASEARASAKISRR